MRHRFHSICPYYAMFPEAFAERWIEQLTRKGDCVLDPFSGRGTTALSALLMERTAVATDVNHVAFCLTRAKTAAPALSTVLRRISELEASFDGRRWVHQAQALPEFFEYAYQDRTLQQLLFLRDSLKWQDVRSDNFIAALVLGSLHGEMDKSGAYFSNQMPRTISTKPAYSVRFWKERELVAPDRDVFSILKLRARFRYETPPPNGTAVVLNRDMRELAWIAGDLPKPIRCAITSPPYFDVTNVEEDQWLRLWFLGGPEMPTPGRLSRDDRYSFEGNYWRFIADMWRSLGSVISRQGHVVIRIGSSRWSAEQIEQTLTASAEFARRRIGLIEREVSELKNRQTDSFRPGAKGISVEVDCHYQFRN